MSKKGLIDIYGVIIRVVILTLILAFSSVAVSSYETRIIEPQAHWEILIDSFDREIDFFDDIAFYDATEGWVIGKGDVGEGFENNYHGIIMHTSNGGSDWKLMHSEKYLTIDQIEIVDVDTIWLATRWGLLHTEDRGQTWEYTQRTGDQYPYFAKSATAVEFRNSSYGLASVDHGLSYTDDAGETWHKMTNWNFDASLYRINFVGDDIIWACGYSGIYRSSDSGNSWVQQRTIRAYSMSVLSEDEAWALGYDLGITHSTDGETWSPDLVISETGHGIDFYYDMEFIDENNGWAVGTGNPSVAYTPDGGVNWYAHMTSSPKSLKTVDFINETHGWAAGWNGVIVKTENGNQFGQKLIIDGLEVKVLVNTLVIPPSVITTNVVLLIVIPVIFLIERLKAMRIKNKHVSVLE